MHVANSQAIHFPVKVNNLNLINLCVNKTWKACCNHRLSLYVFYWFLNSHPTGIWVCKAYWINHDLLFFCMWRNAAKICINVINWHFTQWVPIRHWLSNNLFLVVYDRACPQACPQITVDWLLGRQKKRTVLPSKPLPLPMGLLIHTIKVLALSNPERELQWLWPNQTTLQQWEWGWV